MLRRIGSIVLTLIWYAAACRGSGSPASTDSGVHTYAMTQTVSIPLTVQDPAQAAPTADNLSRALWATPGAEDELPEGPDGFDVLEDGRLLVSDPLNNRLAEFDAQGKFRRSWKLDFSPDSVTLVGKEVIVRDAATGQLCGFDVDGHPEKLPDNIQPNLGEVRLESRRAAVATLSPTARKAAQQVHVSFDSPGMSLLSVEIIAVDKDGNSYLAIESTQGGDEVNVRKDVRKYSPSGALVGQVLSIPLDYYIPPVNELRVRNGVVFQMDTTKSEVRINMWNTK